MGWKSTLFVLMSVFFMTTLNGQSCGETFFDSGGENGDYSNNELETWTICPDNAGDLVTIDFTAVSVENCCDDLAVFSGMDQSVILNADVEGPVTYTSLSADGCIVVTWDSDGSAVFPGWEATISCLPIPVCATPVALTVTPSSNGGSFAWSQIGDPSLWDLEILPAGTLATGIPTVVGTDANPFVWTGGESDVSYDYYVRASCGEDGASEWSSPFNFTTLPGCGDSFFDNGGEDGDYSINELESWTFCPDNAGDLITLDFTFVDVESCCDDLSVYSGSGTNYVLEIDLEAPGFFNSFSPDGCLTVTWDSDGSVVNGGWAATIGCIPAPACSDPTFLRALPTSSGAFLSWLQVGDVSLWDLEIGPAGFIPTGIPTVDDVDASPYMWAGGVTGQDYEFYVRANCDGSEWVGPVGFTTVPPCGDSFYDSGGPDEAFQNNESSVSVFCPDNEGDQVTLNFTFVDIDPFGGDVLSVFNGNNLDGQVLNGGVQNPEIFTSNTPDGCLTVSFFSNAFTVYGGWEAIISCDPPPPCPNPSFAIIENITASGADFSWTENGNATAWDIEIVEEGTDPTGMPTVSDIATNSYVWDGGESGTAYHFYMRAQCGNGEFSYWVGPFVFRTLPGCGDSFFDTGGPNGEYESNELLSWTFCPDNEGDVVVLDFIMVDVEGCCDDLIVINGTADGEVVEGDLEAPAGFISTADNGCLTVNWDSDGSVTRDGWEATITCTSCPPVLAENVFIDDVNAFDASVSWATNILDGNYSIEYDTTGFSIGEGSLTTGEGTLASISGLEENTSYDFYLSFFCSDGELSTLVGPYTFTTLFDNDLGITELLNPSDECGFGLNESIQIGIANYGASPQTLFPINFSVDGVLAGVGQPQDGFYTGIVSNDSTEVFEFDLRYNFDLPGEYLVEIWTDLEEDGDRSNDTLSIVITKYGVPFFEDFESEEIPAYITTTPDEFVTADHNNTSFVLANNLFSTDDFLLAELPTLGPIGDNDTLYFDYRYTDWSEGTVGAELGLTDTLTVRITDDCGETLETAYLLTGNNHEPTAEFKTAAISLEDYAESNIKIQILGIYGSGDMWLDIDNINIPTCDNISINAEVVEASAFDSSDGQISLTTLGGIGPFSYLWDNGGGTDETRTDLSPGEYVVVVTDRFGCSTSSFIEVTFAVGTENLPEIINSLQLMPNPTAGFTQVKASFTEALDAQLEVVNLLGQTVWKSAPQRNVNNLDFSMDLSHLPNAMYLVRVYAAEQVVTTKLLKTQ